MMSKVFNGRVVMKGNLTGKAVVSRQKVDFSETLSSTALIKGSPIEVTGKIFCLPGTAESCFGGLFLHTAYKKGIAPAAMLFSGPIDEEAASGIVLGSVWTDQTIVAVDNLGQEFLDAVKNNSAIEIKDTGEVIVS